jgi:glucuronoarabinoxylan endo-1,4-beta-xylanase
LRIASRPVHLLVILAASVSACGSTDSSDTPFPNVDAASGSQPPAGSSSGSSSSGSGGGSVADAATGSSGGGNSSSSSSGGGGNAGTGDSGAGTSRDAAADAARGASDAGREGGSSSSGGADAGQGGSGSGSGGETAGLDAGPFDAGKTPGTAPANAVVVDPGTYHQRIAGFGASSAWEAGYKNAADPTALFSTTGTGAGLSLFRVRIQPSPAGTTSAGEIQMALAAQKLGATVWATPWTPPPADKSNDSTVEGTLTNPSAWAASLASYVGTMKAAGINLYAVSANNEPDANVTYESCVYTGATMATFVGSSMGPALAATGVKVMEPETQNWFGFATFEPALEANAEAWAATQIVATHEYGGNPAAYPHIQAAGKEFWETEWFASGAEDATMTNGLVIASTIYQALTIANMNAWHYWWFYPMSADNAALWDMTTNTWAKRMWVMGNFSRWARPGYYRVDVSGTTPAGISVIAFQNPADGTLSVVVINTGGATTVPIFVKGASWPASVVPWITSPTDNIAIGSTITVTAGSFSAPVKAQSVTTFVGAP